MLTVYGRATSSNVQALLWGLEELGLSYERLDYGENHGGLDTDDFRAMNPHGKIPVLKVGNRALFETAAILRYLAGQHGDAAFWPRDPVARAEVDMWAEWAKHDVAEAFTGPVFWRVVRTPRARWDVAAIRGAVEALENQLAIAEPRLAKTAYLCGDDLSLADIQFGHVLFRYFDIEIERREFPEVRAYFDRLAERPAYRTAVMLSYEMLRDTV
ncbi:Glutathione S-transferase GstB [Roseovarius litorisediminis]|uniref:Glutathione S-transferase GstB n=1 Tax=Roseovarius litorisediminis TaxID=1312363 RepID=A0A1Y5TL86_9RHOB|nr:glutathione S-transferase family protein [Roseovarius litorisediminis]SLN64640.1 Glutathione S-transferase GstB [Roseovarius litorisediminis]